MNMLNINTLVRSCIARLKPYSCARDEFKGEARVFVDANENPFDENKYNRYPDPLQMAVKQQIAGLKKVRPTQIMLGNGSDEPIDLIYRIFCDPTVNNAVAIAPTYGMYGVCADINNVEYRSVNLNDDYSLDASRLLAAVDANTRVIWLCSPNNPTGNLLNRSEIKKILVGFNGIVVVDEAYVDFSSEESWLSELNNYPNLIVLQTFSKAWGMASVRCGMAFASEEIIGYFNKVKYPYNINKLTQEFVLSRLQNVELKEKQTKIILDERPKLVSELEKLSVVEKVYASDANFLLVRVDNAPKIYNELASRGIVVRSRHNIVLCNNCLRITIGTADENKIIVETLKEL